MLYSLFYHLRQFYAFRHTGAGIPTERTPALLASCLLFLVFSSLLSALAHHLINLELGLSGLSLSASLGESVVRHFFVGTLMMVFCSSQRMFCFCALLAAFNIVLVWSGSIVAVVGLQASLAVVGTFALWSALAAFKFRPAHKLPQGEQGKPAPQETRP